MLAAQPGVRDLVENGWVRLFALDPEGVEALRHVPGRGWEPVDPGALDEPDDGRPAREHFEPRPRAAELLG